MKLTQEQLAELIAKVFANLDERRRANKEGEAPSGGFSIEEIVAEISNIFDGMEGSEPVESEPTTEPASFSEPTSEPEDGEKGNDEGGVSPELIAKVRIISGVMQFAPFYIISICFFSPHKVVSTERNKQKFRLAQFNFIIRVKRCRRIKRIAVKIDDPICVAWQQDSFPLFGIKYNNSMITTGDLVVAKDLYVHVISSPHKVFTLYNLVIFPLTRAIDTDNPAAYRLHIFTE